jgi:hypothetical protein
MKSPAVELGATKGHEDVTVTPKEVAVASWPIRSVPVADVVAEAYVLALTVPLVVALMAPVAVPVAAEMNRLPTVKQRALTPSPPPMVTVSRFPDAVAEAPTPPGFWVKVGAGAPPVAFVKVTEPVVAGAIVTMIVPVVAAGQLVAVFSQNWKEAAVAEVPPTGTVPAVVTNVEAATLGATAVARREARSAALVAALIAFFIRFK